MIGDYIKDPSCGLGKVIKLRPGNELVYFSKQMIAYMMVQ